MYSLAHLTCPTPEWKIMDTKALVDGAVKRNEIHDQSLGKLREQKP